LPDQIDLFQIIREILNSRSPNRVRSEQPKYKRAAVLIPFFEEAGDYKILFTKRTNRVEHHKGQISFPGGSVDEEDDTVVETVLREAREEIGLQKNDVEILGRIDDALTIVTDFIIHPFVGMIRYPYDFTINEAEVKRLIKVPLSVFHPEISQKKAYTVEFEGATFETLAYEYKGDFIWGATARIMDNLMDIIGHKLPLPEAKK
jgi:8-oxo-dGTP pyrophosphatase MutT (NUDIX family)